MKSKILLALTLLLGASTTIWAVGNSGKANQKKHAYTNEDVWAAYEGFNTWDFEVKGDQPTQSATSTITGLKGHTATLVGDNWQWIESTDITDNK